jgi:hypothetical protein
MRSRKHGLLARGNGGADVMCVHWIGRGAVATIPLGFLSSFLALMLVGCAGMGTVPPVRSVTTGTPKTIGEGALRSLQVSRVYYDIPKGTTIGTEYAGAVCRTLRPIVVDTEPRSQPNLALADRLRKELQTAGYPIVQSENKLFVDDAAIPAELFLGAFVREVQENRCSKPGVFGAGPGAKGGVYMKVEWQLMALPERRVVYTMTTEGAYTVPEFIPLKEYRPYAEAFAAAVKNLLADEGFHGHLIRPSAPEQKLS